MRISLHSIQSKVFFLSNINRLVFETEMICFSSGRSRLLGEEVSEKRLPASFCASVHFFAWDKSISTGQIDMKFHVRDFH